MGISEEQIERIKNQLLQQIDSTFPEDKRESAKQQIKAMNSEQLEIFLKQNNLIKSQGDASQTQQCIFCSIISGDAPSTKIDENEDAIAILEINPISKAHALVIPKKHISSKDKIQKTIFSFAEKIAEKIKTKFKPKDVLISSSNLFGHEILNILPVYKDETLNSEKHPAKPEELEEIQKILTKQKKEIVRKPKRKKLDSKKLWLPKRIP